MNGIDHALELRNVTELAQLAARLDETGQI